MIEVTDEMVEAYELATGYPRPDSDVADIRSGIAAVLAIIGRDYSVHRRATPEEIASLPKPQRRLKSCLENWPEAIDGDYDPRCCRFPKECSAATYDPERVTEADLEPEREW